MIYFLHYVLKKLDRLKEVSLKEVIDIYKKLFDNLKYFKKYILSFIKNDKSIKKNYLEFIEKASYNTMTWRRGFLMISKNI